MRLQKATRCALYAILELASDPKRQLSANEIAEKYDISTNHLAKVLRSLGREGLVEAVRGAGGGYRFSGN
ncbi:MAG: Rrf2 family transcriptional regulator, partial [Rhodospirillales bacterium]